MIKCVKKIDILEAVQYDGSACSYDRVEKFVAHHARTKYCVHPVRLQGCIHGTSYFGMQLNEINTVDKIDIVRIFNTTKLMQLHIFDWLVFDKNTQEFEIYDENELASFFC